MEEHSCELQLALGESRESFKLENAVCNHGLFMMAPNRWIPSKKTLERPLRLSNSITSLTVSIQQPYHDHLLVRVHGVHHLSHQDQQAILTQVSRMLRISSKDERDVQKFQSLHPEAKKRGFGRIFRSPTLFEDAIKSILLCNCKWARTLKMSEQLCMLQLQLSSGHVKTENYLIGRQRKGLKRKSQAVTCKNSSDVIHELGNFPSAQELANLDVKILEDVCNLGYRASQILKFSKMIASGKLKLNELADQEEYYGGGGEVVPYLKMHKILMKVKGFGPFSCANVLICSGYYRQVPIDSETVRHLVQVHGRQKCNTTTARAIIHEIYDKYSPYECLAYWFELLDYYESKHGKLSELPNSSYSWVTGSIDMCRDKKSNNIQ